MDRSDLLTLERNSEIEEFQPGDTVRVHAKVVEGERERTQVFEGVVIRRKKQGSSSNFTVRRVTQGIGVERTFLYHSPRVERVEVTRRGVCAARGSTICATAPDAPPAFPSARATRSARSTPTSGASACWTSSASTAFSGRSFA